MKRVPRLAVIVPMKPLALAKQRLRPAIGDKERQQLARSMFLHVLTVIHNSGVADFTGVVSSDTNVLALAQLHGFECIADESQGYNVAIERASRWSQMRGAAGLLILPADLPLITVEDIQALLELAGDRPHAIVIAPDATETGTNALLLRPPDLIQPSFGPDSYNRHCALARDAGVEPIIYRSPSLAYDIDLPSDLNHLPIIAIS